MKRILRNVLISIAGLLVVMILAFVVVLIVLTATEYKPAEITTLTLQGQAAGIVEKGDTLHVTTWNTGYCALGDNADFFMDGGSSVITADEARVNENLTNIQKYLTADDADVIFLQEMDRDSSRSHHINEVEAMQEAFPDHQSAFANNYKVAFVPYPIPPLGKVDSGLMTLSRFGMVSAQRLSLPVPFKWPVRTANLKRCLLLSRVHVQGTRKDLVLVNLHLEAYDNGEGKIAQAEALSTILQQEAEKGNYIIAGGDFNQIFSNVDMSMYPVIKDTWQPGVIDTGEIPEGLTCHMDNSSPTCRSLDRAYKNADHENFQYYMIDGFIVSSNIRVKSLKTQSLAFQNSDHEPVVAEFQLKK